jgi:hypothetical protein
VDHAAGFVCRMELRCASLCVVVRVNSRPRGYNGTQSAFADTNNDGGRGVVGAPRRQAPSLFAAPRRCHPERRRCSSHPPRQALAAAEGSIASVSIQPAVGVRRSRCSRSLRLHRREQRTVSGMDGRGIGHPANRGAPSDYRASGVRTGSPRVSLPRVWILWPPPCCVANDDRGRRRHSEGVEKPWPHRCHPEGLTRRSLRTRWPAGPKDLLSAATWPGRGSDEIIEDRDRLERSIRVASAAALACLRVDPSARPSPVQGRVRTCSGLRMTPLGGGFSNPLGMTSSCFSCGVGTPMGFAPLASAKADCVPL